MANMNVYLPDDLAEQIKVLGRDLNVSALVQEMLRRQLESFTNQCSRCGHKLPAPREAA